MMTVGTDTILIEIAKRMQQLESYAAKDFKHNPYTQKENNYASYRAGYHELSRLFDHFKTMFEETKPNN